MSTNEVHTKSAWPALLRLLTRRDYSQLEIRNKLRIRYSKEAIEDALRRAEQYGYLKDPATLAQNLVESLHRKGKSAIYIRHQLQKRGLPQVSRDEEREFEKALDHLRSRFDINELKNLSEKQKAFRMLKQRGFDSATIRKVLNEKS